MNKLLQALDNILARCMQALGILFTVLVGSIWMLIILGLLGNLTKLLK